MPYKDKDKRREYFRNYDKFKRKIKWSTTPKGKLHAKKYNNRPEIKARRRELDKIRRQKPEFKLKQKDRVLKKLYNISLQDYNIMKIYQKEKCAICNQLFKNTPEVDHNHVTGKVRGLLCTNCNLGIGKFNENINTLQNAINYIKRDGIQTIQKQNI